jgi:hypothetical protein
MQDSQPAEPCPTSNPMLDFDYIILKRMWREHATL